MREVEAQLILARFDVSDKRTDRMEEKLDRVLPLVHKHERVLQVVKRTLMWSGMTGTGVILAYLGFK